MKEGEKKYFLESCLVMARVILPKYHNTENTKRTHTQTLTTVSEFWHHFPEHVGQDAIRPFVCRKLWETAKENYLTLQALRSILLRGHLLHILTSVSDQRYLDHLQAAGSEFECFRQISF